MDRFDRFTDLARNVLRYAQDEAQQLGHTYIGTEHMLLGLVRVDDGVGARVLQSMGVELGKLRTAVEFIVGQSGRPASAEIGLTPGGKRVIELGIEEAHRLGHDYIGTEHLLLGLIKEGAGIAAGVLDSQGVKLDRARRGVIDHLERSSDRVATPWTPDDWRRHGTDPDLLVGRKRMDHLAFWVLRREGATDYWDGNWLETEIELAAGGVRAHVTADLRANEFQGFREDLEQAAARKAVQVELELMEPWMSLRLTVTSTGQLKVAGDFYDALGIGNRVEYDLVTDLALSDLDPMIRELRAIEARFPVIGSVDE